MRTVLSGFKRFNLATFSRLVDAPAAYEKQLSLTLHFYLLVSSLFIVPMAACPDDVVLLPWATNGRRLRQSFKSWRHSPGLTLSIK